MNPIHLLFRVVRLLCDRMAKVQPLKMSYGHTLELLEPRVLLSGETSDLQPPVEWRWNGDGRVDALDLVPILSNWGAIGVTTGWAGGDPDNQPGTGPDGNVDAFDLVKILGHWGEGIPTEHANNLAPDLDHLLLG